MQNNYLEKNRKFEFFLNKFYHLIFSEKFNKKIDYNFDNNKTKLDLINFIINKKKYKSYLEIGCDKDEVFSNIIIDKIGVDPVAGGNYRDTSDNFFLNNKKKFDCIFIDGLHEYSQVLKDIKNSINSLSEDGTIVVHDCLPKTIRHQHVPRCSYRWNGDVWKAIVEVRSWKNLNTVTVLIDEGVGIIKKMPNKSILNLNTYDFKNLKFKFLYKNYKKIMRTISYDDFIKQFN